MERTSNQNRHNRIEEQEKNSKEFACLFLDDIEKKDVYLFLESGVAGFSVKKEYPHSGLLFQPLKNQNGDVDSVALIKIYYLEKEISEFNEVSLHISISLVSRYLLNGRIRYNYNDPTSPSYEALQIWEKELKPVDLTEEDYCFNIIDKNFYNKKTKEKIDAKTILENIFVGHLKTVKRFSGAFFRLKYNLKAFGEKGLIICRLIRCINSVIFSRRILKDDESYDHIAYELFLKPIPHKLLVLVQPNELKILGATFYVAKRSILISSFLFFSTYVITYFNFPEINKLIGVFVGNNLFIATSFIIVWFFLYDGRLPHLLLGLSNTITRIVNYVRNKKISV